MYNNRFFTDDNEHCTFDELHYEHSRFFDIRDLQTSDTLVLHPSDHTTNFLSAIYESKGWDVLKDSFADPEDIVELIKTHGRIVCLGHGSANGLHGGMDFLIHAALVPLLKNKHLIAIWCNADIFMKAHGLKGFYCGMFLSECQEADLFNVPFEDELQIDLSNDLFASVLGKHIDSKEILANVKREYQDENDPIITFNRDRLYSTTGGGF